jgi:ribosomal protein S18 acetylase RimI-like enzyme
MRLTYTQADESDLEAVWKMNLLQIEAYENPETARDEKVTVWVRRNIETHLSEYTRVSLDGQTAAYCRFHVEDDAAELHDLCVLPEFRRRGIAIAILNRCLSQTDRPVALYVFIRNRVAVSLYRKAGFTVVETIRNRIYRMEKKR